MQRRLHRAAEPFARRHQPVQAVYELIVSIADRHPGTDGDYSHDIARAEVQRYIDAAHRHDAYLLLDIQPGRSDFLTIAKRWAWALEDPYVGLALDPEWRMDPGQVPGQVIGHVDAREVNATTAWLEGVARDAGGPEKLVVIHQFTDDMVDETALKARKGLQIVLNADGFGSSAVKRSKYHAFTRQSPGFQTGFKLFYEEDLGLMTPRQVLRLRPPPDFVVYE
jgi:hypothetical protein